MDWVAFKGLDLLWNGDRSIVSIINADGDGPPADEARCVVPLFETLGVELSFEVMGPRF